MELPHDAGKADANELAALLAKHGWLAQTWLTNFCVDDTFSRLDTQTQSGHGVHCGRSRTSAAAPRTGPARG